MIRFLKKLDHILVILQEWFLIFTVIIMVGMIVWQVLARYVLYIPVPYAEEFARLAIVWCIFIGGALACRLEEHAMVEILIKNLPRAVKFIDQVLLYLLMLVLTYVMIRFGWKYYHIASDDYTTSLHYCRNIFYLPCVISGIMMMIYTVINLLFTVINFTTGKNLRFVNFDLVPRKEEEEK